MYSVTVLTPKGRRQQVKVTPNTTLLQVLEEVCTKHGFNANEYDLRHHNKVLDVSSMFRFTSLPNNAQLEMTEALKQREESPVTLGLQFESGERVTGVFSPSDNVWNVIITLKPEEEKSKNLVVIYMRQEIVGKENLRRTVLRSLGLTGGRAMLRVLHKSPEELHTQANVSTNLPPRTLASEKPVFREKSKSPEIVRKESPESPRIEKPRSKTPSPEPVKKDTTSSSYAKAENFDFKGNIFEKLLRNEKVKKSLLDSKKTSEISAVSNKKTEDFSEEIKKKTSPEPKSKSSNETPVSKGKQNVKEKISETKSILLGERNAVAYNLNNMKPVEFEEEPDDFYDLTISDAKLLLKQAKQLCADLEDAPLMTSAQRELEKDKKVLSLLHQYKKTVLRVKFPDRTVLQGVFSSLETISAVEKFVTEYLEKPDLKFYLYTTPPKVILKPEERLIECGCVPCCILHFGIPTNVSPPTQYLKTEVLNKLSTPSGAALTANQTRGINKKIQDDKFMLEEAEKRKWSKNHNPEPGPSGSAQWENKQSDQESSPQFKVPKWFKTNK